MNALIVIVGGGLALAGLVFVLWNFARWRW
jgi:hypothetical protein